MGLLSLKQAFCLVVCLWSGPEHRYGMVSESIFRGDFRRVLHNLDVLTAIFKFVLGPPPPGGPGEGPDCHFP